MTNEKKETPAVVQQKTLADKVMARIHQFEESGELVLPKTYSAENALKSAYLTLVETVDRDKKPVLETCTQNSIVNSLLQMVIEGLSPMKKQCYFIAYGKKLSMQRSYAGQLALAKRVSTLVDAVPNIIYDGDIFQYEIDSKTGRKKLIKHEQDFENIDDKKIKGGYVVRIYENGDNDIEIMNMFQIKASWSMSQMKSGNPVTDKFPTEMVKRTLINRACKLIINSSDDASLHTSESDDPEKEEAIKTVKDNTAVEEVFFDEAQVVDEDPKQEPQPEPKKEETKSEPVKEEPKAKKEPEKTQGNMFPEGPGFE